MIEIPVDNDNFHTFSVYINAKQMGINIEPLDIKKILSLFPISNNDSLVSCRLLPYIENISRILITTIRS